MPNMNDLTLSEFKNKVGLGTRPNRYDVNMVIPGSGSESDFTMTTEVSSLGLPASTINPIRVGFRGRTLKLPGDRDYGTWAFTVIDPHPSKSNLWQKLHNWSNRINNHVSNETNFNTDEKPYVANWVIHHHDLDGSSKAIKEIKLVNCWPTSIGEFSLGHGRMDELATFSVSVEYEYFETLT
jgi:hypothetical protein